MQIILKKDDFMKIIAAICIAVISLTMFYGIVPVKYDIKVGDTAQFECYVRDDVDLLIQYSTSDENILKIDSNGMMTRTGSGEVTIYVYVYGLYAEIDVDL